MGFNLGAGLLGAAEGALMGGPGGAVAGGLSGALGAGSAATDGNLANGLLGAAQTASDYSQAQNEIETMRFENGQMWQNTWFNQMIEEKSQQMSEVNSLRDVAMQQRKADDSITREYIQSIKS